MADVLKRGTSETIPYVIPEEGSLGLLALGARGVQAWRRARAGQEPFPTDEAGAPSPGGRKKVLLIGWDAADWRVIRPLMDQGLMPALQRLVRRGTSGNLATLDPPLSPMLWTSIGTGKTADQHGVLGFVEPTPDGQGLRPVLGTTRKSKAVWNILNQEGYRSHVVGWWPSHPAEPVNGVCVSNFYHQATAPYGEAWPLAPGAVHPPERADVLAALRVHPGELTGAHILPFIPRAAEIDQEKDRRLGMLAKTIADAASVHAAATYAMEHEPWDFMAVYYDAIDHFGHGFMKFHPPRRPGVPEDLYDLYRGVVTAGYRFHDMMLERLLALVDEDTTVLLISDHGFHPDHLRPSRIPDEPAGPAAEHRDYGIIGIAGPGIRADERLYGASLLDVAPTVLSLFGLPIGRDMRGKPLVQAFKEAPDLAFVDSWEAIDGEDGMHPPEDRRDPWAEQEAMRQLIELGYIEAPGDNQAEAIEKNTRESQFYLARVLMNQHRYEEARPLLERLHEETPDQLRYGLRLARCYREANNLPALRRTVERVEQEYEHKQERHRAGWQRQREEAETAGDAEKAAEMQQRLEQPTSTLPALDVLHGSLCLDEGRLEEALICLRRAEEADPQFPDLYLRIGSVYMQQEHLEDAERAFLKALTIDPDSAQAHHRLGLSYFRQGRLEEAAEAALRAVGLLHFFPGAHYLLGQVLMRLGYCQEAARAFEVCVAQAPGVKRAHTWLSELYRIHLGDPVKAQKHLVFATENIIDPVPAS